MHENSLTVEKYSKYVRAHTTRQSQKGNVWEEEGVTDFFFFRFDFSDL